MTAAPRPMANAWAALWFAALAILISYPLVLALDTHVPGSGAGDNLGFLWNTWWARHLAGGGALAGYFHTGHLFAPFGASLVLHTHTALEAVLAGVVLEWMPLVRAHNLVLLGGLAANGFAAYLLSYAVVRRAMPSIVAGTAFASCAYLSVHLLGHVNLTHAWVLPVACLAWRALLSSPSLLRACGAAVALAAVIYTDYYYLVYAGIFAAVWSAVSIWDLRAALGAARHPRLDRALIAAGAAAALAALLIHVTSGVAFDLGPLHVSVMQARNPTAIAGGCALIWLLLRAKVTASRVTAVDTSRVAAYAGLAVLLAAVLAAPVLRSALTMVQAGDYVSQRYFWRSGPRGIDLATVILGPPMHGVTGAWTTSADLSLGIDRIEQTAWLGVVTSLLLAAAIGAPSRLGPDGRRWLWVCAVFGVWSLGPSLVVAGHDTGILLPQALARYVPIVSNARMPGRAIVMVQLAASVLSAMVLSRWSWSGRRLALVCAAVVFESVCLPFPIYSVPAPDGIDARLLETGDAVVVELPTGLRDGFGEWGRFDHRALVHQMWHGRRLVGGFAARIPPSVTAAYRNTPVLAALFDWSAGGLPADALPGGLGSSLRAAGVRFVVVDTDVLTGPMRGPLEARGLHFVAAEVGRELYAVE